MDQQQSALPGIDVEPRTIIDQRHEAEKHIWEQHLGDLPLGEVYIALLEEGWYWRDAALIAWKAMPRTLRQPETKGDLADLLGCSQRTLYRRERSNPAIKERAIAFGLSALAEKTADIVEALIQSATNPNYKHHPDRKLALEMAGAYRPKQGFILDQGWGDDEDLSDLSEEELRQWAQLGSGEEDQE